MFPRVRTTLLASSGFLTVPHPAGPPSPLGNNVHLKVVSDRLNHSTTHIAAEVYSHVTQPIAKEAADLVGRLILGEAATEI